MRPTFEHPMKYRGVKIWRTTDAPDAWYYADIGQGETRKSLPALKRVIDRKKAWKGQLPEHRRSPNTRYRRYNPLTGEEDLGLAFLGLAIVGLVGYGLYSKMSSTTGTTANPNVQTAPNQMTQEAYDAWVMQQIKLGNVTVTQAGAGG